MELAPLQQQQKHYENDAYETLAWVLWLGLVWRSHKSLHMGALTMRAILYHGLDLKTSLYS